ncbi:MAG TPA: winged helix-turn-helix domain-containing protein, partial [Acidimicrobiales bacterium]
NLFAIAAAAGVGERLLPCLSKVVVAGVGPVTAMTLDRLGVHGYVAPPRGRLGLMARQLAHAAAGRGHHLLAGGGEVVVRGSVVRGQGARVDVPERERAVLDVLLRRPGAVVPRAALLKELWGKGSDPKSVDSAIARLRRRLAPTGLTIQTLPRRGYRLDATVLETTASQGGL